MAFQLPPYHPPNFSAPPLSTAPPATLVTVDSDGLAPPNFHATSNHPEYVKLANGNWLLASESRMDGTLVCKDGLLEVKEPRNLRQGDQVVVDRTENGEQGIFVYIHGFTQTTSPAEDKFAFRTRGTRETPFSRSYDELYRLLRYEKEHAPCHPSWL